MLTCAVLTFLVALGPAELVLAQSDLLPRVQAETLDGLELEIIIIPLREPGCVAAEISGDNTDESYVFYLSNRESIDSAIETNLGFFVSLVDQEMSLDSVIYVEMLPNQMSGAFIILENGYRGLFDAEISSDMQYAGAAQYIDYLFFEQAGENSLPDYSRTVTNERITGRQLRPHAFTPASSIGVIRRRTREEILDDLDDRIDELEDEIDKIEDTISSEIEDDFDCIPNVDCYLEITDICRTLMQ